METLEALGYPGDPVPLPSLALGAVGMSPLEVAQIYNTLAGGGYYSELKAIRAVTSRDGEPLNRYPLRIKRVFDERSVYLLNWILRRAVKYGTARSAYYTLPSGLDVAGKTGTTDEFRDSWFAGFAENRVAVVWIGYDDNRPGYFTGAGGALQLWARAMRDLKPASYHPLRPEGIETVPLILETGDETATAGESWRRLFTPERDCDRAVAVPFIAGSIPEGLAPCRAAAASVPDDKEIPEDAQREEAPRKERNGNWFTDLFR